MSKKINIVIAIISIIVILVSQVPISLAADNGFFFTNKQEISQGDTLEMTLDISQIKNSKFEFKLTSNLDASSIVANQNVEMEKYNDEISIEIDKSKTSINKVTLSYPVPETAQVGTQIELVAQVTAEIEVEEPIQDTAEDTADTTDTANQEEATKTETQVVENKKIVVKIIEKSDNQSKPNDKENNTDKPTDNKPSDAKPNEASKENAFDKSTTPNVDKKSSFTPSTQSAPTKLVTNFAATSTNLSSMTVQETAKYNGSSNNYLAGLEVVGENLNTTFNKDNSTYFIQTSGKTEVSVNAAAEESGAKINITGTTNLKSGDNKILISVTAENGDVRYYRVFVTNK